MVIEKRLCILETLTSAADPEVQRIQRCSEIHVGVQKIIKKSLEIDKRTNSSS